MVYVFSHLGYYSSSASTKLVISSANDMGIGAAAAKLMSQSFIDKNVHLQSFGTKNVTFFKICIQPKR